MSQENVEAFNRAIDAINSGDFEAVLQTVHPAVEWHAFMEELLGGAGRVYSGHEVSASSSVTSATTSTNSTGSSRTSATSATGSSLSAPFAPGAGRAALKSKRRSAS